MSEGKKSRRRDGKPIDIDIDARYRGSSSDPRTSDLLVNNRATLFGLDDAQGYVTVHLARYEEFIAALNGREQQYREANIHESGLNSPLLDLLSVRYIIIPADIPHERRDLQQLVRDHPTAYQDTQVRVLENEEALPRAWLVHEAQQVERGNALPLLAAGTLDPRRIALLETALPPLEKPGDSAADRVNIVEYQPDLMRLDVETRASGLLVLSEAYDPAWKAMVDGMPAQVYVVDHVLRGVAVPAGKHVVELRYASRWLLVGVVISVGTSIVLLSLGGLALWRTGARRGSRVEKTELPTVS